MGRHEERSPVEVQHNDARRLLVRLLVKRGEGLVEQQRSRGMRQRTRQLDATALPARELTHRTAERLFGQQLQKQGAHVRTRKATGTNQKHVVLGIKLLDFIPPEELAIAARAMVELFYDLGDRTNRARARLRHLRTSLGDDVFRAKYLAYFSRHGAGEYPPPPAFAADWSYHAAPAAAEPAEPADQADYARWIALAVEPNRFEGEASVTLFVPFGVLTPPAFAALVDMLESFNVPAVRLTDRQNVFIPSVPRASLPALYNALRAFPVDLTLRSIVGKVTSCIGAAVCKAGILDCPKYARMVAEALDAHFKSNPGSFTPERARAVMDRLRLSGCPNSCNDHEQAAIGLQGMRKRVDGELVDGFTVWRKDGAAHIGAEDPEFIPAADLPARIVPLLTEAGIL